MPCRLMQGGGVVNVRGVVQNVQGSVSNYGGIVGNAYGEVYNATGAVKNVGGKVQNLQGFVENHGGTVLNTPHAEPACPSIHQTPLSGALTPMRHGNMLPYQVVPIQRPR